MSDMPSWWYGGNPNTIPQNDLAQNTAALSNNQNFYGGLAGVRGQDQASLNNAYGPQGFGGATAQAAYAGAAAGRGTGGFNAVGGVTQQVAPAYGQTIADFQSGGRGGSSGGSSVFDTGTSPVPYSPPPGSFSPSPNYIGGRGGSSVFDTGSTPVPYQNSPPMGSYSPSPNYPGGSSAALPPTFDVNRYFTELTGNTGAPKTPSSAPGGGTLFIEPDLASHMSGLRTPSSQSLLGYNPDQSASFAPSTAGTFQSRFGFGFPNAGTPSQYTTDPYTDAGGTTHQPNIPTGFQTPFGVDNPGGALPASRGSPFPVMGAGGDEGSSSQPGTNVGGANPFTSGASPFPFAGGYQGSMRDRIAQAITGPTISGPPMVNGGPQTPPPPSAPAPTAPQMNNAFDMLRQGRGMTIAQQTPPPQSAYAPINQAIYDIGNVSRPGMFDNTAQPLGSMFSPGTYRGR